jgi:hypothetical protein
LRYVNIASIRFDPGLRLNRPERLPPERKLSAELIGIAHTCAEKTCKSPAFLATALSESAGLPICTQGK